MFWFLRKTNLGRIPDQKICAILRNEVVLIRLHTKQHA